MLNQETIKKLLALKLIGMAEAFSDQIKQPAVDSLSFEERFGLIVDRHWTWKENNMMSLIACEWVRRHHNILITGPTGAGKTFIACALTNKACREGYRALYIRSPKFFYQMALAKGDGSYGSFMKQLSKAHVLVLDDLGVAPMSDIERRDLLEVVEERHGHGSTIITSQFPVDHWHEQIGDPTIADAILDRLIHNAHKINMSMKGDSMRKKYAGLT